MDTINNYQNIKWNWQGLSSNPNLTIEMINKYPDELWDWHLNITES